MASLNSQCIGRLFAVLLILIAAGPLAGQGYIPQIQRWVAQDALNPPPSDALLFVGSSSIRRWEMLARDFSDFPVIQRGFGGSQFTDLNGFVGQIVLPYDPLAIVVFEGTNDTAAGKSANAVFQDYLQFVQLVHSGQRPSRAPIPIFFIGITPTPARWGIWSIQSQVNQLVAGHCATVSALHYIDVPTAFLATGQPPAGHLFVADNLHLSAAGYALFSATIRATVSAVLPSVRQPLANLAHPPAGARVLLDLGPSNPQDGDPTPSPDAFGNYWNNWHPVDGGVGVLAGESLGDLVTTNGVSTGIDFVVTGGFLGNGKLNGGLLAPQPALLGELAVASATQDYFFCTNLDSPGGFALTGLDPLAEYELRAFASRDAAETRVTRYTGSGPPGTAAGVDLQTSGVGAGSSGATGNDDDIAALTGLQPDVFGQLFLDVQRLTGSFGYLGILELEVADRLVDLGPGCGAGPPRLAVDHAKLGAGWTFAASHLPANAFLISALSFGRPIPTSLPAGCLAFVDLAAANHVALFTGVSTAAGEWTDAVVIPGAAGFDGAEVVVQLGVVAGGGPGFELSNGIRATLRL